MRQLLCFVISFFFFSFAAAAKRDDPSCKQISGACMACDDLKFRDMKTKNDLHVTAYECAVMGLQKHKFDGCKQVSNYCAVCPDGTFKLMESGSDIKADLYECATHPRRTINARGAQS